MLVDPPFCMVSYSCAILETKRFAPLLCRVTNEVVE